MGGSGGGSSGQVSFPPYMQTIHSAWLDDTGNDTPDMSLTAAINVAHTANPYTGLVTYDPSAALTSSHTAVQSAADVIDGLNHINDFTAAYSTAQSAITEETTADIDTVVVNADIEAYQDFLTDQLENQTLPQFRVSMLNIGAVNSSAFIVGEALMRGFLARDVAKYGTELKVRLQIQQREIVANHKIQRGNLVRIGVTQMMTNLLKRAELEYNISTMFVEHHRIEIVSNKERIAEQADFDEKAALWDVELFQYAQNLLSGPSGGVHQNQKRPNKAVSALAGAVSGAAMGASVGGWYGAAIGAVAGAGLAMMQ